MAKQKVDRLKMNPPLGRMPVLQILPPHELEVDGSYQRSIEAADSQALIKRIAQHWNWDLCQPLVVSRRRGEQGEADRFFVIDGQHRLEASRLRGDIGQLPCVVVEYAGAADEAASFVHLNQQRRPLSKLQLFRAAVSSGDAQACAIVEALADAGLEMATHTNWNYWKPGMVSNAGGIERAWEKSGEKVTRTALRALGLAFQGQVMRFAGTIFPGIVAVCTDEMPGGHPFGEGRFETFLTMLTRRTQVAWRDDVARIKGEYPDLRYGDAAASAIRAAWGRAAGAEVPRRAPVAVVAGNGAKPDAPARPLDPLAPYTGTRWCDQCDMQVSFAELSGCKSRWCTLKKLA
ncbi:ParB/RepB/Spo0J family partition protein [Novosphingobium mangrovi (ex Huang et al. 2023)]|uniref:ParB/RepB/Spo0J family partition protein n=1 Tax=Novosphingobium mangrovi (ex Huang et al. 2023) TaxID=2976432 RepID=A0ABT2I128_9SPHN|nr:ParB/RepB/Spo0J family partition protein [Novosphingobium mangrovi (ex Huang et al. 2023)]MCT2398507.1 ParB/RepB/Spo0J family partition protein [Novosphingobium mangrovi (ex Huang et al. 2023)]